MSAAYTMQEKVRKKPVLRSDYVREHATHHVFSFLFLFGKKHVLDRSVVNPLQPSTIKCSVSVGVTFSDYTQSDLVPVQNAHALIISIELRPSVSERTQS